MMLSPSVPVSHPRPQAGSLRCVLAVVGGDRAADERTLQWACALSEEHQARLTVLCLWSLPPLWPWVALSGAGAAVQMLELHRREVLRWVHESVGARLAHSACVLSARQCESPARLLALELRRGNYGWVVGSRRSIGRRAARRASARRPGLTVVRI